MGTILCSHSANVCPYFAYFNGIGLPFQQMFLMMPLKPTVIHPLSIKKLFQKSQICALRSPLSTIRSHEFPTDCLQTPAVLQGVLDSIVIGSAGPEKGTTSPGNLFDFFASCVRSPSVEFWEPFVALGVLGLLFPPSCVFGFRRVSVVSFVSEIPPYLLPLLH